MKEDFDLDSFRNETKSKTIKVAIDPDVSKSGFATLNSEELLRLYNFDLFDLTDTLKVLKERYKELIVIIEAGWLINYNYSSAKSRVNSKRYGANVGNDVGRNFEIGMQIEKFCIKYNITYVLSKPLPLLWGKDKDGFNKKISHEQFINLRNVKGRIDAKHLGRTNQEQRDAALFLVL